MGRLKKTSTTLEELILAEGWDIVEKDGQKQIEAFDRLYPYRHPLLIHNHRYRTDPNPDNRYRSMVAVHHYYWPHLIETWNYWEEEIYYAHCENWSYISLASGAGCGKSHTMAKVVLQHYLSDPENNAAIVASTTLGALGKRVFGYIANLVHQIKVPVNFKYTKSPSPEVTCNPTDQIHCISALAAGRGTDEETIKNYIGRHPRGRFILALDEAPDLDPAVLKAVANLEAGEDGKLQVWVLGNSNNKSDLHGALSTPLLGWKSIDPNRDVKWRTTQPNGVCIYLSPYRSPAIHEPDEDKREKLSKFLITEKQIEDRRARWGKDSPEFWRMVMGFWQDGGKGENTFTSAPFLEIFETKRKSLWSGLKPLRIVGGFDPAFSTGGDKAVLRLAYLGHTSRGETVLDFRDETLLFRLQLSAVSGIPLDIQLADQLIDLLIQYNCKLEDVTFDVTGQGRAFPELVRLQALEKRKLAWNSAIKVWSARSSGQKNQPDVEVKTPTELWDNLRQFIQTYQICGLDETAYYQLSSRLLIYNLKTRKRELESKLDYKNRMSAITPGKGTSPDEADAASLCVYSAIKRYGFHLEQASPTNYWDDPYARKWYIMHQAEMVEEQKAVSSPLKATFSGSTPLKVKGPV